VRSEGPTPLGDGPTDNFDDAMFYMNDHSVRKWKPIPMGILGRFTIEKFHRCGLPTKLVKRNWEAMWPPTAGATAQ
jgi:hypothetical protein